MKKTWFNIVMAADGDTAEVSIDDYIGSWNVSAKSFCDQLKGIKAGKINVRINSGGGDFFDACAMATALQEHAAEVTCHVEGLAASAASLIAVAGDKCLMSPNGFMMIHNVLSPVYGNAAEHRKEADLLDKLSGNCAAAYAKKSGQSAAAMQKYMDDETWFGPQEAVECGLADGVKDPDDDEDDDDGQEMTMRQMPRVMAQYKNIPERLRRFAASLTPDTKPVLKEAAMAAKITLRDGKQFVTVDGKEIEIEASSATAQAAVAQIAVAAAAASPDAAKIKADAIAEEKQRRKDFNTAVAVAKVAGKDLEELEKFYDQGMSTEQLKFLASRTLAARAQAVGETDAGTGAEDPAKKATDDIRTACEKRFAKDGNFRRYFRCNSSNPSDPAYKAALEKYVAIETKCRADEARKATREEREAELEADPNDPVSKVLRNKSLVEMV